MPRTWKTSILRLIPNVSLQCTRRMWNEIQPCLTVEHDKADIAWSTGEIWNMMDAWKLGGFMLWQVCHWMDTSGRAVRSFTRGSQPYRQLLVDEQDSWRPFGRPALPVDRSSKLAETHQRSSLSSTGTWHTTHKSCMNTATAMIAAMVSPSLGLVMPSLG